MLCDDRVTLRPLDDAALTTLVEIVGMPSVREWWSTATDPGELRDELYQDGEAFAVVVDGEIAGWVGFYEENTPDYRHAGLDIILAPGFHDRGLGPDALRLAARWLIDERGHHRIVIDPSAGNARAIRAYEKVGFRRVGIMRRYSLGHDGHWHDGLLMDMLADELT